jgi:hypothetical protein
VGDGDGVADGEGVAVGESVGVGLGEALAVWLGVAAEPVTIAARFAGGVVTVSAFLPPPEQAASSKASKTAAKGTPPRLTRLADTVTHRLLAPQHAHPA